MNQLVVARVQDTHLVQLLAMLIRGTLLNLLREAPAAAELARKLPIRRFNFGLMVRMEQPDKATTVATALSIQKLEMFGLQAVAVVPVQLVEMAQVELAELVEKDKIVTSPELRLAMPAAVVVATTQLRHPADWVAPAAAVVVAQMGLPAQPI
jgi:hypothetical protein